MRNSTTQQTLFTPLLREMLGVFECDLIYLPEDSDILPTSETLAKLPLYSNVAAYVRDQKHQKLFYVDKTEKICTEITPDSEKTLEKFDKLLKPDDASSQPKTLKQNELALIAAFTGHTHLRLQKLNILIVNCPHKIMKNPDGSKKMDADGEPITLRDEAWNRYKQTLANELVSLVAKGKLKEAEAMIVVNPLLLLEKGTYTDFSGRTRTRTAFQAALAAQDVAIHLDQEEMAEMIAGYLDELEAEGYTTNENNKRAQYQAQFPSGWQEEKERRLKRSIQAVDTFFAAVRNAPNNVDLNVHCAQALEDYQTYFREEYIEQKNTSDALKNAGTDFEEEVLVKLYKAYAQDYEANGGWDSAKNKFVWQNGVGFPQRFVSVRLASNLCQGIYYLVEKREKPKRQLIFRYNPDLCYFPFDLDSDFRLGCEYVAATTGRAVVHWRVLHGRSRSSGCGPTVEKLCQAKTAGFKRLMCSPDQGPIVQDNRVHPRT